MALRFFPKVDNINQFLLGRQNHQNYLPHFILHVEFRFPFTYCHKSRLTLLHWLHDDIQRDTYYYDPFGRRLWKKLDGVSTYFLYSDEGLNGEYDATGAEIRSYGYVPDSQWTTNPLFVKSAGAYDWYQNDHLGTAQKIIRTNGSVVWANPNQRQRRLGRRIRFVRKRFNHH
jgi:hypothetical protein